MDAILSTLVTGILGGGPHAVIAILLIVIGALWLDRRSLIARGFKQDQRIEHVIDQYQAGNMTLVDALRGLQDTLRELRKRL